VKIPKLWLASCALAIAWAAPALAQNTGAAAPAPPADRVQTSLKVQVVISKYKGDTRLSSVPFSLTVTTNDRKSLVQSGTQVLIPMVTTEGKTVGPVYKDVGTHIECSANGLDANHYKLNLLVEDSTLAAEDQAATSLLSSAPSRIRSFRSEQVVVLTPGETTQYTTAEDRQSGEQVRVSVSIASLSTTVTK